jgi:solute carrier family 15 (peptide/histidine transporter), member 3/4
VILEKINMPLEENIEYTQDGTVDLKGKPVLRSKTGGWKACSFLVGSL